MNSGDPLIKLKRMDIQIRPETVADQQSIYRLIELAFGQSNESRLVDLFRKDDCFIPELSLVALMNEQIIGHIIFTKIVIKGEEGRETASLALAPMAVLPEHQKSGVGGKLIRAGLAAAKKIGHQSVIVMGHKDYYPKFGFVPAERWEIGTHYEVPSEYFMAMELLPGALSNAKGIVEYSAPFSQI